jgi:hypothetical protein
MSISGVAEFIIRWKNEGLVFHGSPFCMNYAACDVACNRNKGCDAAGECGFSFGARHRAPLMFWSFWVSVTMMILVTVGIFSLSTDKQVVEDTFWVRAEGAHNGDILDFVIGLKHVTGSYKNSALGDNYEDFEYNFDDDYCVSDYCKDCADAAGPCEATVIMALVTEIPAITTKLTRSHVDSDTNCQKYMGIITTILSMISTLVTLSTFGDMCYRALPTHITLGSSQFDNMKYTYGPGMACVLIATLLKMIDIVIMCIVPVGKKQTKISMANKEGVDGDNHL